MLRTGAQIVSPSPLNANRALPKAKCYTPGARHAAKRVDIKRTSAAFLHAQLAKWTTQERFTLMLPSALIHQVIALELQSPSVSGKAVRSMLNYWPWHVI
jgi:hypothetical protein